MLIFMRIPKYSTTSLLLRYNINSPHLIDDDRKSLPVYSTKKKKQLEIETEFKILKSLIPNIANKQQINEVSSQFFL